MPSFTSSIAVSNSTSTSSSPLKLAPTHLISSSSAAVCHGKAFPVGNGYVFIYVTSGNGKSVYIDLESGNLIDECQIDFGKRSGQSLILVDQRFLISGSGGGYDIQNKKWTERSNGGGKVLLFDIPDEKNQATTRVYRFFQDKTIGEKYLEVKEWPSSAEWDCSMGKVLTPANEPPTKATNSSSVGLTECNGVLYLVVDRLLQCYSKHNKQWEALSLSSHSRSNVQVLAQHDRYILIMGDYHIMNNKKVDSPKFMVEIYDTQQKVSTLLAPFATAADSVSWRNERYGQLSAFAFKEKIILLCGGLKSIWELSIDFENLDWNNNVDWEHYLDFPQDAKKSASTNQNNGVDSKPPSISTMGLLSRLPNLPAIPAMPSSPSSSLPGRIQALDTFCNSLGILQEQGQLLVGQSEKHICEAYDAARDLELKNLNQRHQIWSNQILQMLKDARSERDTKHEFLATAKEREEKQPLVLVDLDDYSDDIPSQLRCPITLQLMKDPVVASDGNTYERVALEKWFARQNGSSVSSPLSGATMSSTTYFPCLTLKRICEQYANKSPAVKVIRKDN